MAIILRPETQVYLDTIIGKKLTSMSTKIDQDSAHISLIANKQTQQDNKMEDIEGRVDVTAGKVDLIAKYNGSGSLVSVTPNFIDLISESGRINVSGSQITLDANTQFNQGFINMIAGDITLSGDQITLNGNTHVDGSFTMSATNIEGGKIKLWASPNTPLIELWNSSNNELQTYLSPISITTNSLNARTGYFNDSATIQGDLTISGYIKGTVDFGSDTNPIFNGGFYAIKSPTFAKGLSINTNSYIRIDSESGVSLIGWSNGNNIHVGDYNRSRLPNSLILNSKKVQAVNASGSLVNITDNTSDEREKNILSRIEQEKAVEFIKNLVPIAYQYKAEPNPVTHWGFGAQTTLAAVVNSGIGESRLIERNPYIPDAPINPEDDSTFFYSMKPDELAGPFVAAFQYLFNEIEEIKTKIGGI